MKCEHNVMSCPPPHNIHIKNACAPATQRGQAGLARRCTTNGSSAHAAGSHAKETIKGASAAAELRRGCAGFSPPLIRVLVGNRQHSRLLLLGVGREGGQVLHGGKRAFALRQDSFRETCIPAMPLLIASEGPHHQNQTEIRENQHFTSSFARKSTSSHRPSRGYKTSAHH